MERSPNCSMVTYLFACGVLEGRATRNLTRRKQAEALHAQLGAAFVDLPTQPRPMSVRSCGIWLLNIRRKRYTMMDASARLRCGHDGAGKR
jgi:hypothetical protein